MSVLMTVSEVPNLSIANGGEFVIVTNISSYPIAPLLSVTVSKTMYVS